MPAQEPLVADVERPLLDAGAFVAGLEYAAETEAEVVGKPTAAYFETALAESDASPETR